MSDAPSWPCRMPTPCASSTPTGWKSAATESEQRRRKAIRQAQQRLDGVKRR
jgi:hypothetical protein